MCPPSARLDGPIDGLPMHASELAVERHMAALARQEHRRRAMCRSSSAAAPIATMSRRSVDHLIQRGEFLTAYTPYQPEIAQGTLQMLFEFQTQVARLLGCDVANAVDVRRLDRLLGSDRRWRGGSPGAARRSCRRGLHPHYVSVAQTMAKFTGDVLDTRLPALRAEHRHRRADRARSTTRRSCVVVQYPDILGRIADLSALAEACHAKKALLIAVVTEPVALGAIKSPGEMGADIVVGEGQSIGVGLQFGGPYVGLFGCKDKYVRQMPGGCAARRSMPRASAASC